MPSLNSFAKKSKPLTNPIGSKANDKRRAWFIYTSLNVSCGCLYLLHRSVDRKSIGALTAPIATPKPQPPW